jgi:hypothetical protein
MRGLININEIARIKADLRTKEQVGYLAAYLVHKVDFFKSDSFIDD